MGRAWSDVVAQIIFLFKKKSILCSTALIVENEIYLYQIKLIVNPEMYFFIEMYCGLKWLKNVFKSESSDGE